MTATIPATVLATLLMSTTAFAKGNVPPSELPVQIAQSASDIMAHGEINSIQQGKVNLSHGEIAEIGWPSMTMDFGLSADVDVNQFSIGQKVKFYLMESTGGMYQVTKIVSDE